MAKKNEKKLRQLFKWLPKKKKNPYSKISPNWAFYVKKKNKGT